MTELEKLAVVIYAACYEQYGMISGPHDLNKIDHTKAFKMLSVEQRSMHMDQARAALRWMKEYTTD